MPETLPLGGWVLVLALGGMLFLWLVQRGARRRREGQLRRGGLDPERQRRLGAMWPLYRTLPPVLRGRLDGWAAVFLERVSFEACGGLERVRDDMRLLVAGQACLLLAGEGRHGFFPRLRSVLLYPGEFVVRDARGLADEDEAGVVDGVVESRLGESWHYGSVVLGWDEVSRGARARDGFNLVLHEFAHQLDFDGGPADGAPRLDGFDAGRWRRVFAAAYAEFERGLERGRHSVLDDYAATNPAEFFAVAVEAFFERGAALRREAAELYSVLADWFGSDPASWGEAE